MESWVVVRVRTDREVTLGVCRESFAHPYDVLTDGTSEALARRERDQLARLLGISCFPPRESGPIADPATLSHSWTRTR